MEVGHIHLGEHQGLLQLREDVDPLVMEEDQDSALPGFISGICGLGTLFGVISNFNFISPPCCSAVPGCHGDLWSLVIPIFWLCTHLCLFVCQLTVVGVCCCLLSGILR